MLIPFLLKKPYKRSWPASLDIAGNVRRHVRPCATHLEGDQRPIGSRSPVIVSIFVALIVLVPISLSVQAAPAQSARDTPTQSPGSNQRPQEQPGDVNRERSLNNFILGLLESSSPLSMRVSLTISADPNLKATLSSYLLRELRQLPNVVVVDQNAYLSLRVVSFETVSTSQAPTGYVVAIAITKPDHLDSDRLVLDTFCSAPGERRMSEDSWQKIRTHFEGRESFETLWLRTIGTPNLRDACSRIVADFDSEYLEPLRKADQDMRDQIKEIRKQQGVAPKK